MLQVKWLSDCLKHPFQWRYQGKGVSKMFVIYRNNPAIKTKCPGVQSCECRWGLNFQSFFFSLHFYNWAQHMDAFEERLTKSVLHYPYFYDYHTSSLSDTAGFLPQHRVSAVSVCRLEHFCLSYDLHTFHQIDNMQSAVWTWNTFFLVSLKYSETFTLNT